MATLDFTAPLSADIEARTSAFSARLAADPDVPACSVARVGQAVTVEFPAPPGEYALYVTNALFGLSFLGFVAGENFAFTNRSGPARAIFSTAAAPTATFDELAGFSPGSALLDPAGPTLRLCSDATPGAAVWAEIGARGSQGVTGAQGTQGVQGAQGTQGVQGTPSRLAFPLTSGGNLATNQYIRFSSMSSSISGSYFIPGAAGTVKRLAVSLAASPGSGSRTFTLFLNSATTGASVTLTGSEVSKELALNLSVTAVSRLALLHTASGTVTNTPGAATIIVE